MSEAKQHYSSQYHPQRRLSPTNKKTYQFIDRLNGVSEVFEFGCNVGRHLLHFREQGMNPFGIDANATQVFEARFINDLRKVDVGDELTLKDIPDNAFDMVFTNSVLCHIEDISDIIKDLKRITRRHLVMVEAVERQGEYWWLHEYPGKAKFTIKSAQGVPYTLYHYVKD